MKTGVQATAAGFYGLAILGMIGFHAATIFPSVQLAPCEPDCPAAAYARRPRAEAGTVQKWLSSARC